MYHIWSLLRDGVLRKIKRINLTITGTDANDKPQAAWRKGEHLLDVGLPRKLPQPFTHPIYLHTLHLENLQFRSRATLLRSLLLHSPKTIGCRNVQWPEETPVVVQAGQLHQRQLSLHTPEKIVVQNCTAILPFIWLLVTSHLPSPGAIQKRLYIHEIELATVVDILRLLSDGCECQTCWNGGRQGQYELAISPGTHCQISD